ncbi:hypothetical protein [Deinococcus hopiensis]|uniref:Uncharacterized protein n=1 Tax=Deinococcus hopiensis KR-140 TaxID=695939 RepID=A0A1W1USU2_9DEIO|nr:hypothetical protein [Deinococcus hopiensis]SMB84167.1 hypothetical protein SAMN00790413_05018 [Deinococcus hopiensis KR-140]
MKHLPNTIKSFSHAMVDGYAGIKAPQQYAENQRADRGFVAHLNSGVLNELLCLLWGEAQTHAGGSCGSITVQGIGVIAETPAQLNPSWKQVTNAQETSALHIAENGIPPEDTTDPW